jgi:hypothetical protein
MSDELGEDVLRGGALRSYEIARSHELADEDFPPSRAPLDPLDVEPFDAAQARSRYIAALPEQAGQRPPWRSSAWQAGWAHRAGGLSGEEARWWWRAWCAPACWRDARADHPGLVLLSDEDAPLDRDAVAAQWRGLLAAVDARLGLSGRWLWLLWAPRLWLAWLPAADVFGLLVECVPPEALRHMASVLHLRDPQADDAALIAAIDAYIAALDLSQEQARYTALRLLEVCPGAQPAPLIAALLAQPGDATLHRAALALVDEPALFARCVGELVYPPLVECVPEVLMRGGWEGLGAWCAKLAHEPPAKLEPLLPMLLLIHAPEVVPVLLTLLRHRPTLRPAYTWLIEEGANAVAGLLGALSGPCAREAERILDEYIARGHGPLVRRISAAL